MEFDVIYSMLFSGSPGLPDRFMTAGQDADSSEPGGPERGWFDEHEVVA